MLNKIIQYSLHNRLLILVAGVLIMMTGAYVSTNMEVDVFPDLNAPTVVVMTEAHGMAPEEVERMVTFPIETAVNGATGIRRVRSGSSMGFSIVWVEFDWGVDIYNARQTVSEKLANVKEQLPEGAGNPIIAPQSSLLGEIMIFAMTADTTSPMKLRTLADWVVRPGLLSVGGVAQVTVIGGEFKEYQILADPQKLKYYRVTNDELIAACKESNNNASGGFFNEHGNKYLVRGIGRTTEPDEIANTVIKITDGFPIKISDVAQVRIGSAPRIGDGSYRGERAIVLSVNKQPNINTIELTDNLKAELNDIKKSLPPDVKFHTDIFDQSDFIKTSINNVQSALTEGSIFVIVILFLFLMNYRTTLISLLAIPLSLLVAILTLDFLGFTINTMSLGGMAIAIGSLVDDAIIDVENVYKRLRENVRKPEEEKENTLKVIYEASKEIRASILNATLIIIVAFTPLFFLSGMEGRMLQPLGVAYIVALFASLVVALTITPALCSLMLTNEKRLLKRNKDGWLARILNKVYAAGLIKVMKAKKTALAVSILLFVGSLLLFFGFGRSFLPPFNEGSLTINTSTMPGISIEESYKLGAQSEEALLTIPEIISVSRKTGRAELAEHSFDVNVSELDAPFSLNGRSRDDFLREVRSKLNAIPGIIVEVGQPITHRMDHMLSGSKTSIAIKLFGTDLKQMYKLATDIKNKISSVEGVADLNVEQQVEIPQIKITPKREMLAKYGIPMSEFLEFIDYAFEGIKTGDVFEDEKAFDIVLRFKDEDRDNLESVKDAMIDTYDGKKIPLYYVANIVSSSGPNKVSRENVQRKIVISSNTVERDVRSVVNDIQEIIDSQITLPEGWRIEYGGQFESEARASRILMFASLAAILVIFLILYQEFKSLKTATVILLNLPLALIGGLLAIQFSSQVISIPAIIGFITLFGIAVRNGILLISRFKHLEDKGMGLARRIHKGALDRLNPILMTALTAALALIPLALAGDKSGNEIQSPMAIVILGGLLSSTLLNIFIVPVVYWFINAKKGEE